STLTDQTVLWRHGLGTILPLPDGVTGARPRAMNASGDVVGQAYTQNGETHAFFSDGQTIVLLPDLPGSTDSAAYAINAVGQIVGTGRTAAGEFTALLWTSDQDKPIQLQPVPPDSASFAQAVSDTGAVGGTSSSSVGDQDVSHAVIWAAG